ncbi:MAG: nucleotide sugar dehydrogenase [Gammaproteobacteria bacterium]|nr:nucleotide sugar dehydrogenase [Gammaproteobacteria bacterium]MBU0788311.1 nucleotide sugar dehydrogenase [Gammaproteobacteria bacterium]MBU0815192.1 nucleotide sugar dehydrogenase [Gammaproteobacteria bacterium]MBU1785700.1 nucleotide sugar dehydrogenase [Gammaproteobacteria bacterium]
MKSELAKLAIVASPGDSIDATFRAMAARSKEVAHAGLAVVLDDAGCLLGILTDGDLRRAYSRDTPFARPVSEIMVREPVTLPAATARENLIAEVYRRVRRAGRHSSDWIRHILLLDEQGRLVDVIDFFDLLQNQGGGQQKVAVFGMGYVGLTLAVSLANRGHQVTGLDIRADLLEQLAAGKPHVHEPGLREMLKVNLNMQQIDFDTSLGGHRQGVYIIAVGTPLNEHLRPDLTALNSVVDAIGSLLKRGDQIMLRSTVPMGTTRRFVIPRLEMLSGLRAGEDFHVAFAPERTIEGRAMHELRTLPQVIGGLTPSCARKAAQFWSTLTPSVVQVTSLEASELVKLANNTFRDLSFAFANELALLADSANVDAFDLIRAANEGYPRNPMPLPSPGVGGYCLTKDPVLFGSGPDGPREDVTLGRAGRAVNERAALYAVEVLKRFGRRIEKPLADMSILIVGAAFKGEPETSDMRGAVSLDVASALKGRVARLQAWDAMVIAEELRHFGLEPVTSLDEAVTQADAILILNNHRLNITSGAYQKEAKARLIFDGWHQLDASEIEKISGLTYATMGYMTPAT